MTLGCLLPDSSGRTTTKSHPRLLFLSGHVGDFDSQAFSRFS